MDIIAPDLGGKSAKKKQKKTPVAASSEVKPANYSSVITTQLWHEIDRTLIFWQPKKIRDTVTEKELWVKLDSALSTIQSIDSRSAFVKNDYDFLSQELTDLKEAQDGIKSKTYNNFVDMICLAQWNYQVSRKEGVYQYSEYDKTQILLIPKNTEDTVALKPNQYDRTMKKNKSMVTWAPFIAPFQTLKEQHNNSSGYNRFQMYQIINKQPLSYDNKTQIQTKKIELTTGGIAPEIHKIFMDGSSIDEQKHTQINKCLKKHIRNTLFLSIKGFDEARETLENDPTYKEWATPSDKNFLLEWKNRAEKLCLLDLLYASPQIERTLVESKDKIGRTIQFGNSEPITLTSISNSVDYVRTIDDPGIAIEISEYEQKKNIRITTFLDHTNPTKLHQQQLVILRKQYIEARYFVRAGRETPLGIIAKERVQNLTARAVIDNIFETLANRNTDLTTFNFRSARDACIMLHALNRLYADDPAFLKATPSKNKNEFKHALNLTWEMDFEDDVLPKMATKYVKRINEAEYSKEWSVMTALCQGLFTLCEEMKMLISKQKQIHDYKEKMKDGVPYINKSIKPWKLKTLTMDQGKGLIVDRFAHYIAKAIIPLLTTHEITDVANLELAYTQLHRCLYGLMRDIAEQFLSKDKYIIKKIHDTVARTELEWFNKHNAEETDMTQSAYIEWEVPDADGYYNILTAWCDATNVHPDGEAQSTTKKHSSDNESVQSTPKRLKLASSTSIVRDDTTRVPPKNNVRSQTTDNEVKLAVGTDTVRDDTTPSIPPSLAAVFPLEYNLDTKEYVYNKELLDSYRDEYLKTWKSDNNPWRSLQSALTLANTKKSTIDFGEIESIRQNCVFDRNRRNLMLYLKSPEYISEMENIFKPTSLLNRQNNDNIRTSILSIGTNSKCGPKAFKDKLNKFYEEIYNTVKRDDSMQDKLNEIDAWYEKIPTLINRKAGTTWTPWTSTTEEFKTNMQTLAGILSPSASASTAAP